MTGKTDAFLLSGKDIMGVFDEVKERVTARAVMERAGIVFNRSNMCRCPFHQDKTASMKVKPTDKKYFCFAVEKKEMRLILLPGIIIFLSKMQPCRLQTNLESPVTVRFVLHQSRSGEKNPQCRYWQKLRQRPTGCCLIISIC